MTVITNEMYRITYPLANIIFLGEHELWSNKNVKDEGAGWFYILRNQNYNCGLALTKLQEYN